jgi:autotransporter-associated beta strand protein
LIAAGGGGGGAGTTGGAGGLGLDPGAVAAPGGVSGVDIGNGVGGGGDGANAPPNGAQGANGGGGGAHGEAIAASGVLVASSGGRGGKGGDAPAGNSIGGAGGGGAGGFGAVVSGNNGIYSNSTTVTGGQGGAGGSGGTFIAGANGGSGGIGVNFVGTGNSLFNSGTISGGAGGAGGPIGSSPGVVDAGPAGAAGAGGTGIAGAGLTITNSGIVSGGLGGDGVRANAITFTGGTNSLSFTNATSGLIGNIAVSGSLDFAQAAGSTTVANAITGGGNVSKSGAGTITLTGTNTYTGNTTVTQGTLALTGTGSIASSAVRVGTTIANAVFDISGTTSGASIGALVGATDGTVNLGSKTLTITNGATGVPFLGVINGSGGGLTITGGTQALQGTNGYTGATLINGGTLALSSTGSIAQSSLVTVGAGSVGTFDVSGSAGASIIGLAGDSHGIVTLGSQTLTITNASSGNQFFGAINGSGGLTITGGAQVLGGNNGYTGVTTINSGGDLGLNGTASIASSSKVIDNGALDLSVMSIDSSIKSLAGTNTGANLFLGSHNLTLTAANDTYAGIISGTGGLILASGTETITGIIGYSGATTINGGTLVVNSSLASSSGVTVNPGGTLAGTGAVGNTSIAGGTFAPGNGTPGSSMTVNGLLGFTAGSTYAVNINPTTSSFATVTGAATLGGATVNATFANGSYIFKQYAILTAGSVNGTFGSVVNTNLPANFRSTLSYDAKDAYLNLGLAFGVPTGLNVNQQNVANALTNFFNTTGSIPMVFGTLTPAGLTQVSGETATGSQQTTFDAMNLFMGVMTDPFTNGRDGGTAGASAPTGYASTQPAGPARDAYAMFTKAPPAVVPFEQRWSTWGAGFGGSQTTDGNATAGSNNTTSSVYGTAIGADYRISPFTVAGFALAGGGTNFSVAGGGSGHSDLFQAGAFIRHNVGAAYVSAALAYGWQDITTNRTVSAAGTSQLRAQFDANAFSGRLEGGYRLVAPWVGGVGITPYAAAQFTTFDLPAYAEQATVGSNAFALAYGAKDVTDARSELGIRTDKSWAMTDGILTLRGRLAWAHDYDLDRSIGATFQSLPGASFVVNGAAQAADSALVTASIEKKWLNGWSAAATFEGEFSDVTRSYSGKGVVRYVW